MTGPPPPPDLLVSRGGPPLRSVSLDGSGGPRAPGPARPLPPTHRASALQPPLQGEVANTEAGSANPFNPRAYHHSKPLRTSSVNAGTDGGQTGRQRDRQTGRQRDRYSGRETGRQRDRQRDRQVDRQTVSKRASREIDVVFVQSEMEMTSPVYSQQQAPPNQTAPWPDRTMTMHHYGNQNRPPYSMAAGGEGALLSQLCLVLRDLEGLEEIDHMLGIPTLAGQGFPLDQDQLLTCDPTGGLNPPQYSQLYPDQGSPAAPQAYADFQQRLPGYPPMMRGMGPGMGGVWRSGGVRPAGPGAGMAPQPNTLRLQLQHRLHAQNLQPIVGQMGGASNMNLPLRSSLPNQGPLNVQTMAQHQYLSNHLRQQQQQHLHQHHQRAIMMQAQGFTPNVSGAHAGFQTANGQPFSYGGSAYAALCSSPPHLLSSPLLSSPLLSSPLLSSPLLSSPLLSSPPLPSPPLLSSPLLPSTAGLNPSSPDPGKVLPTGGPRPPILLPSPMLQPRPQQAPPPAGSAYQTTSAPSGWTQPANTATANVANANSMYSQHQFQYGPLANGMYSSISQGVTMEPGAGGSPGQMSGQVTCMASEQVSGGSVTLEQLAGANMLAQES
ncbi:unnamed protein product [Lota lota]